MVGVTSRVEKTETQIEELSQDELRVFRESIANFDAQVWDQQFEADVGAGRLDRLGERAPHDHASGHSTKL